MVHAQPGGANNNPPGGANTGVTLNNPLAGACTTGQNCLENFLLGILDIVITIGGIVVILMLVYVGFLFTTTSVNPENKQKAREYLAWTLIGALILLGSKAIALGIEATVRALSTTV
jgi:hypothetical protein